ncbi:UNVERIFIED_CONTAM: hypothetical protein PYX00_004334 [Menopon gallinae]|uniref:Elongation of very long chain fatty acids protein n=1 Tax=Menopon gallinae TaxID=328185 RepID=A0AAW2I4R8_9NEOP
MSQLVASIVDGYRDMMDNKSDPRVKDWSMMSSPFPTIAICIFYAYFSKVLGPKLMENRKPFDLRNILVVYNLLQTIFSMWIFYEYCQSGWLTGYSFRCQPVDYSNNPKAIRMAATCWWYYFSKFTEFFDTFFFVLRKKTNQVSNLHVIHHGLMPFSVWMGLKFAPGGHSTFFALLNTFVHIIMYFYYMVAAMGPKYQKYLWWKKYLTTIQMVQFVFIFTHQFQLLFTDCNYPKSFMIWIGFHGILFLFLFSDFYKTRYLNEKPKKNTGACMPIEEEEKKEAKNGVLRHQFETNNEYSKVYTNCYTDSSSNGYIKHDSTENHGKSD